MSTMKARFSYRKFWTDCRAAREARGWSRAAVGRELGVGGSAVAKWEANKLKREDMWRIMAMCYIYDFDIYAYYEVYEEPSLKQRRLIEDTKKREFKKRTDPYLTKDEIWAKLQEAQNIGYDEEFRLSYDQWLVKWNHVHPAPNAGGQI